MVPENFKRVFSAKLNIWSFTSMCESSRNRLRLCTTDNAYHHIILSRNNDLRHSPSKAPRLLSRKKIHARDNFQRYKFILLAAESLDFYCNYSRYNCIKYMDKTACLFVKSFYSSLTLKGADRK